MLCLVLRKHSAGSADHQTQPAAAYHATEGLPGLPQETHPAAPVALLFYTDPEEMSHLTRPRILAEPWYLWSCMNWGDFWHQRRWCQMTEKSGLFYFHCMRNLCVKNENKFYLLNHTWLGLCLPGRMWKRTARRIMVSIQWLLSALYCSLQQNILCVCKTTFVNDCGGVAGLQWLARPSVVFKV